MTEINNLDVEVSETTKDHSLLLNMAEVWFKNRYVSTVNLFYLNMLINDSKKNHEPLTMSNYVSYVRSCEFPDDEGYTYQPCDFACVASCNESDYGKFPATPDNYQIAMKLIKINYIDVIDDKLMAVDNIALALAVNKDDEDEIERLADLVSACIVYLNIDRNFNIETVREKITNEALSYQRFESLSKNKDKSPTK